MIPVWANVAGGSSVMLFCSSANSSAQSSIDAASLSSRGMCPSVFFRISGRPLQCLPQGNQVARDGVLRNDTIDDALDIGYGFELFLQLQTVQTVFKQILDRIPGVP